MSNLYLTLIAHSTLSHDISHCISQWQVVQSNNFSRHIVFLADATPYGEDIIVYIINNKSQTTSLGLTFNPETLLWLKTFPHCTAIHSDFIAKLKGHAFVSFPRIGHFTRFNRFPFHSQQPWIRKLIICLIAASPALTIKPLLKLISVP